MTEDAALPEAVRQHLGLQLALFYADSLAAQSSQPFEAVLVRLERALRLESDSDTRAFRLGLVAARKGLFARALNLVRNHAQAEDLVQETLLRAWRNRNLFTAGTNLEAWLYTILRHQCMSYHRMRRREVEDVDGRHAQVLTSLPDQEVRLTLQDVAHALQALPTHMRDAFVRVAIDGLSYDDAAAQMGCRTGTVKSRVARARTRLAAALEGWLAARDGGPLLPEGGSDASCEPTGSG